MKRGMYIALPAIGSICIVALFAVLLHGKQIDVLNPSGEVANAQRNILMFTVFLSALVVVPVFTLLIFFSVKYRAGNTKARYRPEWGDNKWLEGLWWGIPIVIIGVLGTITYQTSHSLDPYKSLSGGKPLEVQVVALRWKWLFIYPEQKVATLNYVAAPVDRPIHFSLTADAPMSAFWIPALGSQIYAMNGMESQLNLKATKIGNYTGYTTNINGEGYAKMKFITKITSNEDFTKWTQNAAASKTSMNQEAYKKLLQPLSEHDERTYVLGDSDMFATIIHKNMSHGSSNSGTMNHEMNRMDRESM